LPLLSVFDEIEQPLFRRWWHSRRLSHNVGNLLRRHTHMRDQPFRNITVACEGLPTPTETFGQVHEPERNGKMRTNKECI
jgi:hypothetical protein